MASPVNSSEPAVAVTEAISTSPRHLTISLQVCITTFYLVGIGGNMCALVLLGRGETHRNKKQTLMLRCLAWNDLLAMLGSAVLMYLQLYTPKSIAFSHWFCACRVFWRVFGFGSGCVAIVMAAERWFALTRPFVYQKHITYKLIQRYIFGFWALAAIVVCLPFAGFGLYYDDHRPERLRCMRYRYATQNADVAYAYLFFACGVLLSVCIVCFNILVIRVLCRMGRQSVARLSHTRKDSGQLSLDHSATSDEISFAKLMAVLCIFFVICWIPQMLIIIIVQMDPSKTERNEYRLADICIALNFVLDPYIYVLLRRPHRHSLRQLLKPLCLTCNKQPDSTCANHRPGSVRDSGARIKTFDRK
uniref:G-protein coupled receptors family 1 profile domain-containing protein n=1 Tax=Strigamia maritima TaxID=126957 RepID=T1IN15_STRMM